MRASPTRKPPPKPKKRAPPRPPRKQKYSAEQRRRRRKRRMIFFYTFVILLVLGAAVTLSLTVLFQIDGIRVLGASRYSPDQIVDACGIEQGENLFLAKTKEGQQRIEQSLPYIGSVRISRSLPSTILVEVQEATPAAAVMTEQGYVLLDDKEKVLDVVSEPPAEIRLVKGLPLAEVAPGKKLAIGDEKIEKAFQELVKEIENVGMTHVTVLDFTDPYRIQLVCDGRLTYLLGTQADLNLKLRFGMQVQAQLEEENSACAGQIDLSLVAENDKAYFKDANASSGVQEVPSSSPPDSSVPPDSSE